MQNIPYVKTFNKDGKLENPIDGFYSPAFPNRKHDAKKLLDLEEIIKVYR